MATKGVSIQGQEIKALQDTDDLEDAISEWHEEAWVMAHSVQAGEPLQAKQQFELLKEKFNAMEAYIQALPEPKDNKHD